MSLGSTIRLAREQLHWSKAELGRRVGVTRVAVIYWERNEAIPRPPTRRRLERALGLRHDSLEPVETTGGENAPHIPAAIAPTKSTANIVKSQQAGN